MQEIALGLADPNVSGCRLLGLKLDIFQVEEYSKEKEKQERT